MKQFIIKILVISAILAIIGWIVFTYIVPEHYLAILPFTLIFFLVFSILVHAWILKMSKKSDAVFARSNMLLTGIKLVIYSVFAVLYLAFNNENAVVFVICLMVIYLTYSFLEVFELSRISRKQ